MKNSTDTSARPAPAAWRFFPAAVALGLVAALGLGAWRVPNFWIHPDRHGDRLFAAGRYADAARAYTDPARVGAAYYRNADFKEAAAAFAKVATAEGRYNQGDALLMHGDYDGAINAFDRALAIRPGWTEATENRALAVARRDKLKVDDKTREAEQTEAYKPDEIVTDNRGGKQDKPPEDLDAPKDLSDADLQASWLRRVQTTPGDFLRAKFAWQSAHADVAPAADSGSAQPPAATAAPAP